MPHGRVAGAILGGTLALASLAACSDEARDEVGEAADQVGEDIEDAAGAVGAVSTAEALAVSVEEDAGDDEAATVADVALVQENIDSLPGDPPTVVGLDDADGDGKDDDGKVQVDVGDQSACVTLDAANDDASVDDGAC